MSIRSRLTDIAKKSTLVRALLREARFILARMSYLPIKLTTAADSRLILFESYNGQSYACSPRAIYEYMLTDTRFDDCRFVWAFRQPDKKTLPDTSRTVKVVSGSREYMRMCATAGVIIINSSFTEGVTLRRSQKLIQCWHGTPLKRLGCDLSDSTGGDQLNGAWDNRRRYRQNARRATFMLSPSPVCSERLRSAFDLDALGRSDIIRETGYPRNDMLLGAGSEKICSLREKFGIPEGKRVMLYAPTYRDNSHKSGIGYVGENMLDFDILREQLGADWVVLFRPHYFIANAFDFSRFGGFVINAAEVDEVAELFLVSDLLITDYSSVLFDYAVLGRPMLFYMYDFDSYRDDIRGFYSDPQELPGPIARTQAELMRELALLDGYSARFGDKYAAFKRKYTPLDDGKAAQRAAELLL